MEGALEQRAAQHVAQVGMHVTNLFRASRAPLRVISTNDTQCNQTCHDFSEHFHKNMF